MPSLGKTQVNLTLFLFVEQFSLPFAKTIGVIGEKKG
jgi:hypothetical protein